MGRSQGKQKISSRKTMVRNIDLVRSMLLEEKNYRLRGSTIGMQLFESPEDLIDFIKAGDFEAFWQMAANQDNQSISVTTQGFKALYKDPVFKAFYEGGLRAAEREQKDFKNDYYHWLSRYGMDDQDVAASLKEAFAREFIAGLSDPSRAPVGLDGWIFSGKSPIDEYTAGMYFRERYKNLINENPNSYPDLLANSLDPLLVKYPDSYVASDLVSSLSHQVAHQLSGVGVSNNDPFLPEEVHSHLDSLLGPKSKLGGDGWVSSSAPWRENGVSSLTRDLIAKEWKKDSRFPASELDSFVEKSYVQSLSIQLATVISRDYREKTRSEEPEIKLRAAINKVKNKKTLFRRLKPIFESEGRTGDFNKLIKLDKLETFNSDDLTNLLNNISTRFIQECQKQTPPSPANTSFSKIISEEINSF